MSTVNYHPSFNLLGVLSKSNRIFNASFNSPPSTYGLFLSLLLRSSRHFLTLFVLFLLPLSIIHESQFFFGLVLTLVAVSTITHNTFHGFYGRPVKLFSSIKSALYSFLPLLSTFIFTKILVYLIFLFFALVVVLVLCLLVLGFGIDVRSHKNYLMGFVFLIGIVVFVTLIWLQVNWSLWTVIVVVESKWGYEPLRRSRYLVNGMRRVAFALLLLYGPAIGFLAWSSYTCVQKAGQGSGWLSWAFVLEIVLSSTFITMLLHYLAANVVLYLYCKALHGELDLEIADDKEFPKELST